MRVTASEAAAVEEEVLRLRGGARGRKRKLEVRVDDPPGDEQAAGGGQAPTPANAAAATAAAAAASAGGTRADSQPAAQREGTAGSFAVGQAVEVGDL